MLVIRTNQQTYVQGEPVLITLTLCNDTDAVQEYQFPTSQQFDVFALQNNKTVWTWSDGQVFAQFFTTLTLQPGECQAYDAQWDQTTAGGKAAKADTYTIRGIIKGTGLEATTTIEIR